MKNKKWYGKWTIVVILLMVTACESPKKFVYWNDMELEKQYPMTGVEEMTIQRNDRINVTVTCTSAPELAIPFNVQQGNYVVNTNGEVTVSSNAEKTTGYLVDSWGNIDFPILGTIHVEGLTVAELKKAIAESIVATGEIKHPIVNIEFLNFRYMTMGAIGNGVHTVDGETITLLEALAQNGIQDNARLDRICVIREVDGRRQVYYNDIRTKDIFESPVYYLRQNDIVYVEPKYRKRDGWENFRYYMQFILTPITTVTTLWLLIDRFSN